MPADDRAGCHDLHRPSPVRPQPRQQDPQQAVGAAELQPPRPLALENRELMSEGENLRLKLETGPNGGPEDGEQGKKQRGHDGRERYQPLHRIRNGDKTFEVSGRHTSGSRGLECHRQELRRRFIMFETLGDHAQGKGLDTGDRLVPRCAVAQDTGQVWNLGDPASVVLGFEFD